MKKHLTILLIIFAISFGLLFSFSLASAHHGHITFEKLCPIEMPGCLGVAGTNAMENHHLSILKMFGQSNGLFNIFLLVVFFAFYFTAIITQDKVPRIIFIRLNLKKSIIFKKIFRWLSTVKFSYPIASLSV